MAEFERPGNTEQASDKSSSAQPLQEQRNMRAPATIWLTGRWTIILAIAILAISYGLYFYFQNTAHNDFRQSLFDQQEDRQIARNKAIAQHIGSDLGVISGKLELIAQIYAIGEPATSGKVFDQEMKVKIQQALDGINSQSQPPLSISSTDGDLGGYSPIVDAIYVVDEKGIVILDTRPQSSGNIEGVDISSSQYVSDTKESLKPQYSNGYIGMDNMLRIAATYPIIDNTIPGDEKYRGMVVATMPTSQFFQHYGNIYDIKSQYLAVLDSDSIHLVHPVQSFVGSPFFGEYTQEVTGRNQVLNSLIRNVMSGTPDFAIYEFVNGQRFTSGYPIYFNGKPLYFVFIITPTSTIYSAISDILNSQQTQTFTVLAASTAAVVALVFLLTRWNSSLNREVEDRTVELGLSNQQLQRVISQLQESYRQLSFANERLTTLNEKLVNSERVQKEFINVAAHELRTPIQPIIGLTEIMRKKINEPDMREMIDAIARSAERMHHLSSDILDVTRIESQTLHLNREPIDIIPLVSNVIRDYSLREDASRHGGSENRDCKTRGRNGRVELSFVQPPSDEKIVVSADKDRIVQVVSNLLDNAYKFTGHGKIRVSIEKSTCGDNGNELSNNKDCGEDSEGQGFLLIKVQDTGKGIDSDVLPKLFTKFVTKSERGTGLGLFISKGIVEMHGGKIWGSNNPNGVGASFCFTLPLDEAPSNGKDMP